MSPVLATLNVLDEVFRERVAQDDKWGEQNHPDGTGPDVFWEANSLSRAAELADYFRKRCDDRHRNTDGSRTGTGTFLDILLEEVAEAFAEADPTKLRAELIQVSAVAASWAEAIDRRTATPADPGVLPWVDPGSRHGRTEND